MSNHLISTTYSRNVGSMSRKAVMVLLADKASDDGTGIYASKQTMADELCTSKQTILATIKSLISDGLLIEVGQRRSANGYTVEYAIMVACLEALPLVGSAARAKARKESSSFTGQVASPVKQDDATSQAALPEPPLNPSPPIISPSGEMSPTPVSAENDDEPDDTPLTIEELVGDWNELAGALGLPKVANISRARRAAFRARTREMPGLEPWRRVFATIRGSPWMHGQNDREWRADFDFILQPKSFIKLVEGSYGQA